MNQDVSLDYKSVCTYVGQVFLETRHQLEQLTAQNQALRNQLAQAEQARDEAIAAVAKFRPADGK